MNAVAGLDHTATIRTATSCATSCATIAMLGKRYYRRGFCFSVKIHDNT